MTKTAHVVIDLDDVRQAGSVEGAILAWAERSDSTSSGHRQTAESRLVEVRPNGWTTGGVDAQAIMAWEGGALYYVDCDDGRLAEVIPATEHVGETAEDTHYTDTDGNEYTADEVTYDGAGGWVLASADWSDESVVRLECPDVEDAIEHPATVAQMVRALDTHGRCSDRKAWAELVRAIQQAAEELDGIDPDEIAE